MSIWPTYNRKSLLHCEQALLGGNRLPRSLLEASAWFKHLAKGGLARMALDPRPWKSTFQAYFALCIFTIGKQGSEHRQDKAFRGPWVLLCELTSSLWTCGYIKTYKTGNTYKPRTIKKISHSLSLLEERWQNFSIYHQNCIPTQYCHSQGIR